MSGSSVAGALQHVEYLWRRRGGRHAALFLEQPVAEFGGARRRQAEPGESGDGVGAGLLVEGDGGDETGAEGVEGGHRRRQHRLQLRPLGEDAGAQFPDQGVGGEAGTPDERHEPRQRLFPRPRPGATA